MNTQDANVIALELVAGVTWPAVLGLLLLLLSRSDGMKFIGLAILVWWGYNVGTGLGLLRK